MTPQDRKTIDQWTASLKEPPTIVLAPDKGKASASLNGFCDRLQAMQPGLKIKKETDDPFQTPALIVGRNQNIAFQTVPTGKILEPFLAALSTGTASCGALPKGLDDRIEKLSHPVQLKLYIAQQCPHCPFVVGALLPLAAATSLVRLTIIDAQMFDHKAGADQVRSVPTLIMDDHFRWTGQVDLAEILDLGIERDPAKMSANSLKQILEAGDAPRAAEMMITQAKIFPALIELLIDPRWSVRLGAMVTVEYLADEAPDMAADLAQLLWQRFDDLPAQVQGDVVQVISLSGSQAARGNLQTIASGAYEEEVVEAAREALDELS